MSEEHMQQVDAVIKQAVASLKAMKGTDKDKEPLKELLFLADMTIKDILRVEDADAYKVSTTLAEKVILFIPVLAAALDEMLEANKEKQQEQPKTDWKTNNERIDA